MIEVRNLVKRYGAHEAVRGVSFTVEKGRIYGFLGPNGAGKSTTMNIITGCLAATEGEVTVNGYDIYEDAVEAKRCIGYLPEQPPLYTDMTVEEYLVFVGRAKGLRGDKLYAEVDRVVAKTGLGEVAGRVIRNLSKGYRQRVGIAQAITGDPEIIILDEPTVGLDPLQIIEIRELIRELGDNHTVILSSHILTEISAVCDTVIIIAKGKIVASDTIENLTRMYEGRRFIDLELRGTTERVRTALEGFLGCSVLSLEEKTAGITSVRLSDEGTALAEDEPHCGEQEDIRDRLFYLFAQVKLPILSMHSEETTLETVFLSLTEGEDAEEPEPEVPAAVTEEPVAQTESETRESAEEPADEDDPQDNNDYTPLFGGKR